MTEEVLIRKRSLAYRLAILSNPQYPPETTCELKLQALNVLFGFAFLLGVPGLVVFLAVQESWFFLKLVLGVSFVGPVCHFIGLFVILPFHLDRWWETHWEALKLQPRFLAIRARLSVQFCKKAIYI